ncbi:sec-independent protein translocase TatC [bacterium]|nr:sec-independent protein translocase TatC [bacterium]
MNDIENAEDISRLVRLFYDKAMKDELISHFFTKVVQLNLETHLPLISSFWEATLLGQTAYRGNPMLKHMELNRKSPMKPEHFERWLKLWYQTVDENFAGQTAENAKSKATQIASLMLYKVERD